MSLPYAILGFLEVMPMTGYDLKARAFDASVAHFWPASLPQIYRELDKMAARGWVASEVEIQEGRPNRKVYTITEAGRAALRRWLQAFEAPLSYREPFLIQLFFGAQLSNEELLTLLRAQRAAHAARLAELQAIDIPEARSSPEGRRHALTGLTLELGFRLERTYLEWLDHAAETVEALPEDIDAL